MDRLDFDHATATVAAHAALVVGAACVALLVLAFASELLRHAGRAPRLATWAARLSPRLLRRGAAVTLGLLPLLMPARAGADDSVRGWLRAPVETTTTTEAPPSTTTTVTAIAGPVAVTRAPRAAPEPSRSPRATTTYVVRRGDCLWSIAQSRLRDASAVQIDRAWRRIYDANRAAIGDDPNLIRPGLVLELPPLDALP
jgi:nucleoid-associated protein YgaU